MKTHLNRTLLLAGILISIGSYALAIDDITFPVTELGNCASKDACRKYCDQAEHIQVCIDFAQAHNFVSRESAQEQKRAFQGLDKGGPGDCKTPEACRNYCERDKNIDECIKFAKDRGLVDRERLDEAGRISKALKETNRPGNCKDRKECMEYCNQPNHTRECVEFGKKAGFIPLEEAERATKAAELIERGESPGGCKGKDECEVYCHRENNIQECTDFGVKLGFIKPEQAEFIKKTGGRGPGGCRGQECQEFCSKQENRETCYNFAKENGLVRPEEKHYQERPEQREPEQFRPAGPALDNLPQEIKDCLKNLGVSIDDLKSLKSEDSSRVRPCFSRFEKNNPQVSSKPYPSSELHRCMPRPACLDATPRCLPPEPAEGWCPNPSSVDNRGLYTNQPAPYPSRTACPAVSIPVCKPGETNQNGRDQGGCPTYQCVVAGTPMQYPVSSGEYYPPPSTSDMAAQCAQTGGTWDGSYCRLPNQPDPATQCANSGGKWNGSNCTFSSTSGLRSALINFFWGK